MKGFLEGWAKGGRFPLQVPIGFVRFLLGAGQKKTWIMGPIKKRYPLIMGRDGAPFGQIGFQWPPRWRATGGEGRDVGDIWVGLGAHLPWLGTFEAQEL